MKKIKLKEKTMSDTICKEKCMSNIIRERGIVDLQQNNAITLIALIITIIVLLILAGVMLNIVMGEDGIINKAQLAKEKTNASNEKEQKDLGDLESILEKYEGSTARNEYASKIIKDFSPVIDYINGTECERCGAKLDRKPWTRGDYFLCSRCDFSLNDSLRKTYWLEQRNRFVKINPNYSDNISTEEISLAELVLKVEES